MFCKNCGKEITNTQNFCEHCGYNVSNSVSSLSIRQSELELMDHIINFFNEKKDFYDEYDKSTQRINKLSPVCAKAALVWGIILLAVMSFISLLLIGSLLASEESLAYVLILVPFFIAGGALIFIFNIRNNRRTIELKKAIDTYQYVSEGLENHYKSYENCPIGIEYTNPTNLLAIKRMLQSGRVDTIKESINMLIEDAHRRKMEDISLKTAQYVQSTYNLSKASVAISVADFFI